MSGIRITRVLGSDWQGVYVDGVLAAEGHSISDWDWLDIIKRHFHEDLESDTFDVDYEWLEDLGRLPEKLQDIPKAKLR